MRDQENVRHSGQAARTRGVYEAPMRRRPVFGWRLFGVTARIRRTRIKTCAAIRMRTT